MRFALVATILLLMATAAGAGNAAHDGKEQDDALIKVEAEILLAMQGNMGDTFAELRRKIQAISPESRRALAVSIRPGVFQWRFHGVHPADALQPAGLEYIVSSEIKNYEPLLVVEGKEFERLQRFGHAMDKLRKRSPDTEVDIQLCWSEYGRMCSSDLWEIYATADIAQVEAFIARLDCTESGLGSVNLSADVAALPKKKTPAQVIITLHVPTKK